MRVLFVNYQRGGLSHLIPLLALDRLLAGRGFETAFFVDREMAGMVEANFPREHEVAVLPVLNDGTLRSELRAYAAFRPDVVVDDCGLQTRYATQLKRLPRVAIQRTGVFPFQQPRNPAHRHSLGLTPEKMPDATALGLARPRTLDEVFEAPVRLVPGIPEIEVLPEPVRDHPAYVFSGPLLADDFLWREEDAAAAGAGRGGYLRDFGSLDRFFAANAGREVVFFTYGLVADPPGEMLRAIGRLVDGGMAVVTNVPLPEPAARHPGRVYRADYLPLHHVCSRVKLAVHHCGSAAYHYPLLHGVPSITIGTGYFDREDVAVRLEELGASTHIPSPSERGGFAERFDETVRSYLADGGRVYEEKRARAARLGDEIRRVSAEFDFPAVLRRAAEAA